MRKRLLSLALILALVVCTVSCAGVQKTEIKVVTYEMVAVALNTAKVYLSEREKNGSLFGESLVRAKADYKLAKDKFVEAGDLLAAGVENPAKANMILYQQLLNEAARIAAALSK